MVNAEFKLAVFEINRNYIKLVQWTHMHPPGTYETYLILLLGHIPTWKGDATITKLGWTTYMTPFSKWPTAKWNYVFAYNSASTCRIDRDNCDNEKSLCLLVNSEFKMVTTDTNRNHSFCQILTFMTITYR